MSLLTLLYLRSLNSLRRHMRRHHKKELYAVTSRDPVRRVSVAIVGRWLTDLQMLQMACFDPTRFPVHVLEDDKVFALVKRVRRGVLVEFYGQMEFINIKSLKDL